MQRLSDGLGIARGDAEKSQCWTVWCAPALFPIAERGNTHADHECKVLLGLSQFGPHGLHIRWLKGRDA